MKQFLVSSVMLCLFTPWAVAQSEATRAGVAYGSHERQVLDFYQAKSDQPTPLLFFIHGGGWTGGDKSGRTGASVKPFLNAGISVVSINYRYAWQAQLAGIEPPVKAPLHDAARALQFVRSKAKEWNIDKERIAASGGSAGACSSLWLAFHDDLADPKAADLVSRESTRLWCAAVNGAQTSLDSERSLRRTRLWFHGPEGPENTRRPLRRFPGCAREDPSLDQGVLAVRARQRR